MSRNRGRDRRVAGVANLVGGLEFVSTAAITAAAAIVVTDMEAGYDYFIALEAFAPTTDGQIPWMRFSDDALFSNVISMEFSFSKCSVPDHLFPIPDLLMRLWCYFLKCHFDFFGFYEM